MSKTIEIFKKAVAETVTIVEGPDEDGFVVLYGKFQNGCGLRVYVYEAQWHVTVSFVPTRNNDSIKVDGDSINDIVQYIMRVNADLVTGLFKLVSNDPTGGILCYALALPVQYVKEHPLDAWIHAVETGGLVMSRWFPGLLSLIDGSGMDPELLYERASSIRNPLQEQVKEVLERTGISEADLTKLVQRLKAGELTHSELSDEIKKLVDHALDGDDKDKDNKSDNTNE